MAARRAAAGERTRRSSLVLVVRHALGCGLPEPSDRATAGLLPGREEAGAPGRTDPEPGERCRPPAGRPRRQPHGAQHGAPGAR